jgi:hypothetical protein
VALKVSEEDLNDPARFDALIDIIKSRIFPLGGSASPTQIFVRSSSVTQIELDGIAARLRARNSFNAYTSEHLISVDAVVPSESALGSAQYVEPESPFQSRDLHEITFTETSFRPPVLIPRHLRETPQLPLRAKRGLWQVDFDVERLVDHSWIQSVQHRWRLPRRLRMAGAFARGYQLHSMSPHCMPRATVDGLLSLSCGLDGTLPEINVPTDEAAFRYAICAPRDWWPFVFAHRKPNPGLAREMRLSDKGRYLTALLRMSGGIHQAKEVFLSQFWKKQFERLGASAKPTDQRIEALKTNLQEKFRAGSIESDAEWTRLANLVLAEARRERFPSRHLKFTVLQDEFDEFRKSYWAKRAQSGSSLNRDGTDEREKRSLGESARYLCHKGILLQGHEWRCRQCFNINWESIDNLKQIMVCDVCGRSEPATVADSESVSKRMPDAELDLLLVSDGVVRLVEAKGSSRGVDIAKTAELAKRLRPDVVTLAVMEVRSTVLMKKLSDLQKELAGSDIDADLMTLGPDDIEDSTILPTGESYWGRRCTSRLSPSLACRAVDTLQ